jgi:hypothetical protein
MFAFYLAVLVSVTDLCCCSLQFGRTSLRTYQSMTLGKQTQEPSLPTCKVDMRNSHPQYGITL